jgi:hypothetical protein
MTHPVRVFIRYLDDTLLRVLQPYRPLPGHEREPARSPGDLVAVTAQEATGLVAQGLAEAPALPLRLRCTRDWPTDPQACPWWVSVSAGQVYTVPADIGLTQATILLGGLSPPAVEAT